MREVGVQIVYSNDLREARAEWQAFLREVESRPVRINYTGAPGSPGGTPRSSAADAMTFGAPGVGLAGSPMGNAADRLAQNSPARTPAPPVGVVGPPPPILFGQPPSSVPGAARGASGASYSLPAGNWDAAWVSAAANKIGFGNATKSRSLEQAVIEGLIPPHPGTSINTSTVVPGGGGRRGAAGRDAPDHRQLFRRTVANLGGTAITSDDLEAYQAGDRRFGTNSSMTRRAIGSVGAFAGVAIHQGAMVGQQGLDYQAMVVGNAVMAGGNVLATTQNRVSELQALQQLRLGRVAAGFGIGLGGIGAVVGSAILPGVGTAIGTVAGNILGRGIGGLGYSAINGRSDAIQLAEAQRTATALEMIQGDKQRRIAGEIAGSGIGRIGVGSEISRTYGALQSFDVEMDQRTNAGVKSGALASLREAQTAERTNMIAHSNDLRERLRIDEEKLSKGDRAAQRMESRYEVSALRPQMVDDYLSDTAAGRAVEDIKGLPVMRRSLNRLAMARIKIIESENLRNSQSNVAADAQLYAQGESALADAARNPFGSLMAGFNAGFLAAEIETDPARRNAKLFANQAKIQRGASVLRRTNFEAAYDTGEENRAIRQQRQGDYLASNATRIEAQRTAALREVGGTGNVLLDSILGYSAKRQAIEDSATELRRETMNNEQRRLIGIGGGIRASVSRLNDDPLQAQLKIINADFQAQRVGVTNPRELSRSFTQQRLARAEARQQFDNQRKLVGIDQQYTSQSLDRMLARDPIGAEAAQIAGSAIAQANQLAMAGMGPEAEAQKKIGQQQLNLLKQNYMQGFRGVEIDPSMLGFQNPRDVTNPGDVIAEIARQQQNIDSAKTGSDQSQVPALLGEIKGILQPLTNMISQLTTGNQ